MAVKALPKYNKYHNSDFTVQEWLDEHPGFADICRQHGVKFTRTQASKYMRKKGLVYLLNVKKQSDIHIPKQAAA